MSKTKEVKRNERERRLYDAVVDDEYWCTFSSYEGNSLLIRADAIRQYPSIPEDFEIHKSPFINKHYV